MSNQENNVEEISNNLLSTLQNGILGVFNLNKESNKTKKENNKVNNKNELEEKKDIEKLKYIFNIFY